MNLLYQSTSKLTSSPTQKLGEIVDGCFSYQQENPLIAAITFPIENCQNVTTHWLINEAPCRPPTVCRQSKFMLTCFGPTQGLEESTLKQLLGWPFEWEVLHRTKYLPISLIEITVSQSSIKLNWIGIQTQTNGSQEINFLFLKTTLEEKAAVYDREHKNSPLSPNPWPASRSGFWKKKTNEWENHHRSPL